MSGRLAPPDGTAVRTALWRALHREVDAAPAIVDDDLGLRLIDPEDGWRDRPDMDPDATRGIRAAIVARARFVEDLLVGEVERGVDQYVLLGAGLDTFAWRRPEVASRLTTYEIEQPATQAWKRRRLRELGYAPTGGVRFVPVDFEAGGSWWDGLLDAGFDAGRPAVVVSTGVSMYLTRDATSAVLRRCAGLAADSTVAMTFLLPADLVDVADRPGLRASTDGARASGTPFVSFYAPSEILELARAAGLAGARHCSGATLAERYFAGRGDGLRPSSGEDFLIAVR